MKRSEINTIIRSADVFMRNCGFHLPPFAHWPPEEWSRRGREVAEIVEGELGWDITDFGLGDFARWGLLLFTLRNGRTENLRAMTGKLYAEKIMVVEVGQCTPFHFHWSKTEDIINRGGGQLMMRLYRATDDEGLSEADVTVSLDGICRTVRAGGVVTLDPGESITLPDHLYHEFWGVGERVLVGEVSLVNDDHRDNRFYRPLGRFPQIEEDEPPLYLLTKDYGCYWRRALPAA